MMYDVVIIGAGVTGTACARELSRFQAKICVLEKEEDVCCGTSKANSGIVHAGYDAKEGSLMAKLNVRGNAMMEQLSKDLDFPFKRIGSLVICLREEDMDKLQALYDRGVANGVSGLQILNREEVLEMEPNIADNVYAALYAPTAGIVCPFGLNIAMAENACENGVEFKFDTEVKELKKTEDIWEVHTNQGVFKTKYVVNAAGVYADKFHNMVSEKKIHITPRRGDYCLLYKTAGGHVKRTIFALPNEFGKGILVSPTAHGNLLLGPTAIDIEEKEGTNTTREGLDQVLTKAGQNVKNIPMRQVITSFAGLRAHEDGHEFIIEELEDAKGFIDCAGIESPGLTSSPAIGEMVAGILKEKLHLEEKENFIISGRRSEDIHHQGVRDRFRFNVDVNQPIFELHRCKSRTIISAQADFFSFNHFFCQQDKITFVQILTDIADGQRIGVKNIVKFAFMHFFWHAAVADNGEIIFEFGITRVAQFFRKA